MPSCAASLAGVAMGLTAIALIYSPWGKRSGAHMNPAVTLDLSAPAEDCTWDAAFYILAQFIGGTLGVLLVAGRRFGERFHGAAGELRGHRARDAPASAAPSWRRLGISAPDADHPAHGLAACARLARFTGLVAGRPGGLVHQLRGTALGHEHEPGTLLRLRAPGHMWTASLDLLDRAGARHAAGGAAVPGLRGARRRSLRQVACTPPTSAAFTAATSPTRALTRETHT